MSTILSALYKVFQHPRPFRFLLSRILLRLRINTSLVATFANDPKVKVYLSANPIAHSAWLSNRKGAEIQIFRDHIKRDATVFDVGANVGTHTILAAMLAPQGRVFAFEPGQSAYRALQKNIALNQVQNVTTYNAGISDTSGKWRLAQPGLSDEQSFLEPVGERTDGITTIRLDTVCQEQSITHIDFLKIDVEGAELLVLRSLGDMAKSVSKIFFENLPAAMGRYGYDQADLCNWLVQNNFELYTFLPDGKLQAISSLKGASANVLAIQKTQ